jgi:peptide chain release factor 3
MDRPARDPLELLDELEHVLGIGAYPVNWPLGAGAAFKGVWDRRSRMAHLYERTPGGAYRAPVSAAGLSDPVVRGRLDEATYRTVCEEVEMLDGAGSEFRRQDVLAGRTTPVYFGSALNNFGVQLLLDGFLQHSAAPAHRRSRKGPISPEHHAFSGFVFKIQANMDPNHRDRIAFVRIVSGRFERNMSVIHSRTGKPVRLSNATRLFGRDRQTLDDGYPGDVVGIIGKSNFAIGDTLTEDPEIQYDEIPRFAPECFAYLENPSPAGFKRFRKGLSQLLQEGVVQHFELPDDFRNTPLLGAVGPLQFEVVQHRLREEYGAESSLASAPWTITRWTAPDADITNASLTHGMCLAIDNAKQRALLFADEWHLNYFQEHNRGVRLSDLPFKDRAPGAAE